MTLVDIVELRDLFDRLDQNVITLNEARAWLREKQDEIALNHAVEAEKRLREMLALECVGPEQ